MNTLISSLVCSAYCVLALGQSHLVSSPTTGSDGHTISSGHDGPKTPLQHETTAKGCLLGQNGKYILVTSRHWGVLQLVATPNLEVHAGQRVKITGTIEDTPAAVPSKAPATKDEAPASIVTDVPSSGQLRVRKIKTISATCESKPDKTSKKNWIRLLNL